MGMLFPFPLIPLMEMRADFKRANFTILIATRPGFLGNHKITPNKRIFTSHQFSRVFFIILIAYQSIEYYTTVSR
jgi:hypothetical protein